MLLYITDNPIIKKNIPGSILTYQIYNWKITNKITEDLEDNFVLEKKEKLKDIKEQININLKIIAIINRSNYKLIYELNQLNKEIVFYYWDTYEKRQSVIPSKSYINMQFFHYMQRGYLTNILYSKLSSINLQRVEQFMILVSISLSNNNYKDNNIKKFDIFNFKKSKNSIKIEKLIQAILFKRNDIIYLIDKLMYHSRKNDITDPFVGEFIFKNKNNSLYKIYKNYSNEINNTARFVFYIVNSLTDIIPLVDILKTLRFLIKNGSIIQNENNIEINNIFVDINELKTYKEYISVDKWNFIYKQKTFANFSIFPELEFKELTFKCPVCGSTEFNSSPVNYWCSDNLCNFRLNRIINPVGGLQKISKWDLFRLLKYKETIIKNKFGGYNHFYLKENDKYKGKYHVLPFIEKNDINPD